MESAIGEVRSLLPDGSLVDLLDRLPCMVAYWDPEMRMQFVNEPFSHVFGHARADVLGRTSVEVLGHDLYATDRPYIDAALAGERQQFERRVVGLEGNELVLQVTLTPDRHDDGVRGLAVGVFDVTPKAASEAALEEQARKVTLMEERQRIAADLHDVVIQRLFAVGLDLHRASVGDSVPERVQAAMEGVDEAIRELRLAIHSLHSLLEPAAAPASVDRIVGLARRTLGFAPDISFSGNMERVPTRIVADLLAVLNEALSNIARHAGASSVRIVLSADENELALSVVDNGRGIGDTGRSSGLANMRARAERLGGVFVARDNVPQGTVIDWVVPLPA